MSLTLDGCRSRRARLWARVPERFEWLLIADPRHVHYLCNFWINPLSFSAGERGLLLLERDKGARLIADNFTIRSATTDPHLDGEIECPWYDHKHSVLNRDHALFQGLQSVAERVYGRVGAVEAEWLPVGAWEVLGLDRETHSVAEEPTDDVSGNGAGHGLDLGTLLRELRRQKHDDELSLLREAMRATNAGHARAREVIRPGISEYDVYRAVYAAVLEATGRPAVIYGDFRCTNAETIKAGGPPTQHVLEAGELFILDYSVVLDGYRSDFTNTYAIGSPGDQQMMLFELCEAALASGASSLRAGVKAADVHAAVMEPFRSAGYADAFPHHAGHGIGLGHPEPPILVPASHDVLLEGDVLTLEPGAYVKGIGGMRIEHNYHITRSGAEQLSGHLIALT